MTEYLLGFYVAAFWILKCVLAVCGLLLLRLFQALAGG